MVKHIVFWNVREDGDKQTNMRQMKQMLEGLVGKVEGLISAEVGFNFNPDGHDLVLYSVLRNEKALEIYQNHPEHLKVKKFVHSVVTDRAVVDFDF